ncbi:unnamed protein product [Protopolystoma xenopodis]|uniref:Uncharacterized protein n=1 Tax=Protopolystoma xenopodis TaxID=117903 RepID=A0A3S5CFN5_9PLAT|nr:unnamed protein product [Protopolystoma xenopodis]
MQTQQSPLSVSFAVVMPPPIGQLDLFHLRFAPIPPNQPPRLGPSGRPLSRCHSLSSGLERVRVNTCKCPLKRFSPAVE